MGRLIALFRSLRLKFYWWMERRRLLSSMPTNKKEHANHWANIQAEAEKYRLFAVKPIPQTWQESDDRLNHI